MSKFSIRGLYASLAIAATAVIACHTDPSVLLPDPFGPTVRIQVVDGNGQTQMTLAVGQTATAVLLRIDAKGGDATTTNATWKMRDASVAKVDGTTVTGLTAGSTYIVGSVTENGTTFVDSMRVSVH